MHVFQASASVLSFTFIHVKNIYLIIKKILGELYCFRGYRTVLHSVSSLSFLCTLFVSISIHSPCPFLVLHLLPILFLSYSIFFLSLLSLCFHPCSYLSVIFAFSLPLRLTIIYLLYTSSALSLSLLFYFLISFYISLSLSYSLACACMYVCTCLCGCMLTYFCFCCSYPNLCLFIYFSLSL